MQAVEDNYSDITIVTTALELQEAVMNGSGKAFCCSTSH